MVDLGVAPGLFPAHCNPQMMAKNRLLQSYSVTVGLALVIMLSWLVVSALADEARMTVPTYLLSHGPLGKVLIFLCGPVIHQGMDLLLGNLLFLLALGPIVESRVGWRQYLLFVAFAGYSLTLLAYLLSMPTVGISGVTHALTGREAGAKIGNLGGALDTAPLETLVVALVLTYQLLRLPSGGSLIAHAGGLALGFSVAIGVTTGALEHDWIVARLP